MYSIVEFNNKQYKLELGKPALVDKLDVQPNEGLTIDKVLLFHDDKGSVKIGTPYVDGLKIKAKVVGAEKGKKIEVFKYKKRKDYRRKIGSRPMYTKILIEETVQGA